MALYATVLEFKDLCYPFAAISNISVCMEINMLIFTPYTAFSLCGGCGVRTGAMPFC